MKGLILFSSNAVQMAAHRSVNVVKISHCVTVFAHSYHLYFIILQENRFSLTANPTALKGIIQGCFFKSGVV